MEKEYIVFTQTCEEVMDKIDELLAKAEEQKDPLTIIDLVEIVRDETRALLTFSEITQSQLETARKQREEFKKTGLDKKLGLENEKPKRLYPIKRTNNQIYIYPRA